MLITLEAARKNIGYSQKEAAALFGVHYQTLAKLEEDSSDAPYSFIQLIPKVYKISKDNIFFIEEAGGVSDGKEKVRIFNQCGF